MQDVGTRYARVHSGLPDPSDVVAASDRHEQDRASGDITG